MSDQTGRPLPRRGFLGLVAAASVTAGTLATGVSAANATSPALDEPSSRIVLAMAQAVAVFPVPFGDFGEQGPAIGRATMKRLDSALAILAPNRIASVAAGTARLLAQQLARASRPELLIGLGRLASTSTPGELADLRATAALAVATVSTHFDPGDDHQATIWLGGLRNLYQRGNLTAIITDIAASRGTR